jgi:tRNA pseudouridine55 synthase
VAHIRRFLGERRVGHAGTLDPAASGLLPVVVGTATRLVRFLPHSPKLYRGRLRLGATTDTDDVTGRVLATFEGALPSRDTVLAAARKLEGVSRQIPPVYSARRVGGERLHRLARRGVAVAAPPAEVEIASFLLRDVGRADEYEFEAAVSAGTYIRGLVRDLGLALGCGGTLVSLERTRIGPLSIEDAIPLPSPNDPRARDRLLDALIPPAEMPLAPAECRIRDPDQACRFTRGLAIVLPPEILPADEPLVRVVHRGELLGIAETVDGWLQPRVVLARAC